MKPTVIAAFAGVAAVAIGAGIWVGTSQANTDAPTTGREMVSVTVPDLSIDAQVGQVAFEENCRVCHGPNAAGQVGSGPPLVHKIYEPSHHGDISFLRAAQYGVKAHHWRFGDMPPVEGITATQVAAIITYIRELQRANGIN